jgi:phosphonopyruvate decarboxylase
MYDEIDRRPDLRYIVASSEGDALAIASGLWLSGSIAAVLCQNSGLGNMVNPLASLTDPFRIPVLLIVTLRGLPGTHDEPQHAVMGRITTQLLHLLEIPHAEIPQDAHAAQETLDTAVSTLTRDERPFALLVKKDTFVNTKRKVATYNNNTTPGLPNALVARDAVLRAIVDHVPADHAVIATTGHTSRDLLAIEDRPNNFYCVGSMGYANSIAHGLSLVGDRPVIVIDGDGAALMHLGNLSSIGHSRPTRLTHLVLDNGTYASTGGQPTASAIVDFPATARALGYCEAASCNGIADLLTHLDRPCVGPRLLHIRIADRHNENLPRPEQTPQAIARRFKAHLAASR